MYRRVFSLIIVLFIIINIAYAEEEHWMPDPILRKVVRAELNIPEGTPLMKVDMQRLPRVVPERVKITGEISDLTGLEYAVNLYSLLLGKHHVQDLRPIANLTQLRYLTFGRGTISDLTPLSGLVNLETLSMWNNQIVDVSPLANLVNLRVLQLPHNQIEDFSPLAGLVNLEWLEIQRNNSSNISAIPTTKLKDFVYDETCIVAGIPFADRIENRAYPSVSGSWSYIVNKPPVILRPETSEVTPVEYFDLYFGAPQTLRLEWAFGELGSNEAVRLRAAGIANMEDVKQRREALLAFNPNSILLVPIKYYSGMQAQRYPEDGVLQDLWLRDKSGNRVLDSSGVEAFLDFTLPETQAFVFDQVRAVAACGLFDGIFFDHWSEGKRLLESRTGRTTEEEHIARDRIIQGVREIIGDDMLILVNTGESKIPRWAEYINGTHMETHTNPSMVKVEGTDNYYNRGYTRADLLDIEETLVWSESNFREPQINNLKGYTLGTEPLDSPRNKQWMRTFTTMSLTLSDGYVEYAALSGTYGPEVYWHSFYDAPLGRPIGEKGKNYTTAKDIAIEGLYVREYTNGWAVYNRSGKARKIQLPEKTSGVESGVKNRRWHTIPDLDGEIYLKTNPTNNLKKTDAIEVIPAWDVNEDRKVNIDDIRLVIVDIGVDTPTTPRADVNGDGQVTVADLQLVIDNLDDKTTAEAPTLENDSLTAFNAELLRDELNRIGTDTYAFSEAIALIRRLLDALRPEKTLLLANYPNPFNPETWIPYHLANPSDVTITIYDTRGSIVRQLNLGHQREGYYTDRSRAAYWDGRNDVGERVASGIYFYQLQADNASFLRKMVILK